MGDGNVVEGVTIANGIAVMPEKVARAHIGLQYVADWETLDIEGGRGTIQGALKKISRVTIRFKDTRGLLYGFDNSDLKELKQREFEDMGDPTEPLTGDADVIIPASWNSNGRIFMRQADPLPTTILAVIPELNIDEDNDG